MLTYNRLLDINFRVENAIFRKISVEKKIRDKSFALLSNVVGDKNLRSYLAFKGFGKENQREVEKQDNATSPPQTSKTTE